MGGTVGTRSSMACAEHPRGRVVKEGDVADSADMWEGQGVGWWSHVLIVGYI